MRRLLALPVALSLVACAPEPKPPVSCITNGSPFPLLPAAPVAWPGQRFELPIEWVPAAVCSDGSGETVHGVVVELFDPDNRPIAATATAPVKRVDSVNTRWEAAVLFEPERLGPHHLIATFVPEGGLVQGDVWVVEDRRDAGFVEEYTAGESCERLERTAPGPLLCQNSAGVSLFPANGSAIPWPDALGRPVGAVIWMTVAPNQLVRVLQLPDGGFAESILTTAVTSTLAAVSEDEAAIWSGGSFRVVSFDAGYWSDLLRVDGAEPYRGAIAFSSDAGTAVIATLTQWRHVDLRGPPTLDAGWTPGTTLYQARDGIWTQTDTGDALRFIPADPRQPVVELAVPPRWVPLPVQGYDVLRPGDHPFLVPLQARPPYSYLHDRTQVLVPRLGDGGVAFHHYVAPPGAAFQEVTGGWLRATKGDNHFFFPLDPG